MELLVWEGEELDNARENAKFCSDVERLLYKSKISQHSNKLFDSTMFV